MPKRGFKSVLMAWQSGFPLTSPSLCLILGGSPLPGESGLHSTPQHSDLPNENHLQDEGEFERSTAIFVLGAFVPPPRTRAPL